MKHILENRWYIIFQDKCFLVFDVTNDAFAEYIYHDFPKNITKRNVKISKLTLVNDVYFDFWFHFIMMLTGNANQEKVYDFHVVLNEANVAGTFLTIVLNLIFLGIDYTALFSARLNLRSKTSSRPLISD